MDWAEKQMRRFGQINWSRGKIDRRQQVYWLTQRTGPGVVQ